MNKPSSTPIMLAAFAAIIVGGAVTLALTGFLLYPKQNGVSADSAGAQSLAVGPQLPAPEDDLPLPTPEPIPTVAPIAIPTPPPAPAIKGIPVVAAVKPVQPVDPSLPAICQSQSYSAEREAKCPKPAPARSVTESELAAPLPSTAPTATPLPTLTPVPSISATPAPSIVPTPTATPTPKPSSTPAPSAAPPARDCGGYPALLCNAPKDSLVDPWGMYNRECVSYAAYKVSLTRTMPKWGGRGNAFQWPGNARAAGIPVDNQPKVGDIAILGTGFGHAMYVEAVNGSYITVSQFNYHNTGEFSRMVVPSAGLEFIHF